MAENRCPMCSKENPEEAEVCVFCGARLTPLVVGSSSAPDPTPNEELPTGDEMAEEVPDWLDRIRSQSEEAAGAEIDAEPESIAEPEPEETAGEEPEWLDRLREASVDEAGPPAEDLPDWVEQASPDEPASPEIRESPEGDLTPQETPPDLPADRVPAEADTPDWLLRIRERAADAEELEEEFPVEEADADWLSRLAPQEEGGVSETESPPPIESSPPAIQAEDSPEAATGVPEQPAQPDQEGADLDSDQESFIESDSGVFRFPEAPASGPSWVEVPEEPYSPASGAERKPPDLTPDEADVGEPKMGGDFDSVAAEIKAQVEPSEVPSGEQALPSWLEELQDTEAGDQPPADEVSEVRPVPGQEPPEPAETPAEPELPHVPALVVEGKPAELSDVDSFDLDTAVTEIPDWFDEMKKEPGVAEEEEKPDLAPATLPAWLEAMRPVETFRSGVEIAPEEDQSVESAGPLAGLRGVLIAEPIVAMPRSPSIGSTQLDISERQYAQAEMLQRMVKQEERESVSTPAFQPRLTLLRLLIGILLVAAVLLPILFGFPTFSLPTLEPIELGVLSNTVESLPMQQPVLLVFDYEPGYSAEMEAVAGAFIEQVTSRGLPVATMSTRPTGAQLALALMEKYGSRHGYIPGENLVHLGYLSGGPLAVQLFAASPRDAILQGFALPPGLKSSPGGAWDAEMLGNVDELSDFGMVAVLTSGTDNARNWAEQAKPYMYAGELDVTPLVMVMSAGAEPLLRPYYEASEPRINGLLSGLPAAVAYELRNGVPGDAQARWNPFGAGILLAEMVLLIGIAYGLLLWFLQRNQAKRS